MNTNEIETEINELGCRIANACAVAELAAKAPGGAPLNVQGSLWALVRLLQDANGYAGDIAEKIRHEA